MFKLFSFIIGVLLWVSLPSFAQNYSLKTVETSFTIENTAYKGYQTTFDLPLKTVKKAWWKYIKAKASIFNRKTHYELTLAPERGQSNTPFKFISQLEEASNKTSTTLRVAPIKGGMSSSQTQTATKGLNTLIKDFKIGYFTAEIQGQIIKAEAEALTTSSKMGRYYTQNEYLIKKNEKKPNNKTTSKINQNNAKLTKLKEALKQQEDKRNEWVEKLGRIK